MGAGKLGEYVFFLIYHVKPTPDLVEYWVLTPCEIICGIIML